MNLAIARVEDATRIGRRQAWLLAITLLVGVAVASALATRLGLLPLLVALVAIGVGTMLSLRWPLLPLMVFAALIPIEEVVVIEGLGTLSRFSGILFAVTYGGPRLGRVALVAMPTAGWAYLAWAIVSLVWALDSAVAWAQLSTLIQLFVIALLIADMVVARPAVVRPVLWVYSLSAAVTAILGLVAFVGSGARSVAIQSQDPAQFAAVLLPAVVFGVYEALEGRRRLPGALVALITILGIIVSGTRGAWIALVVVAALVILPQLSMRRRVVAVVMGAVLLVVALQVPGMADLITERSETALSTGGAGRTDIWAVAATIYQASPILGVGYANLPVAYTSEAIRESGVTGYLLEGRSAHNLVIGTVVELGPIGILVLAMFVLPLVLRRGWGPDAAIVQAALASLLAASLFVDLFVNRKQVWLVIGLAAALAFIDRRLREVSSRQVAPAVPAPARSAGTGMGARPTTRG